MTQNAAFDGPLFLAPVDPNAEVKDEPVVTVAETSAPHDYGSIFSARS